MKDFLIGFISGILLITGFELWAVGSRLQGGRDNLHFTKSVFRGNSLGPLYAE